MKRLALLAVTAVMALLLSACGDNAEKKVEGQAAAQTEQSTDAQQLDNANKDVNKELNDSSDAGTTPAATEATPASSEAAPASTEEKPAE